MNIRRHDHNGSGTLLNLLCSLFALMGPSLSQLPFQSCKYTVSSSAAMQKALFWPKQLHRNEKWLWPPHVGYHHGQIRKIHLCMSTPILSKISKSVFICWQSLMHHFLDRRHLRSILIRHRNPLHQNLHPPLLSPLSLGTSLQDSNLHRPLRGLLLLPLRRLYLPPDVRTCTKLLGFECSGQVFEFESRVLGDWCV
jgi:hypothetical protein